MSRFRFLIALLASVPISAVAAHAATIFTQESQFRQALRGSFSEHFEDDAVWGTVRSEGAAFKAAATIAHQGITWRSAAQISTSREAGRAGYGIFAHPPQTPDRLIGESDQILVAIGFWARSDTPPASLQVHLDDTVVVEFEAHPLTNAPIFFGVIEPDGFTRFELVEQTGTQGNRKRFSADDFIFATNAQVGPPPRPPGPGADAGGNRAVTEGDALTLSGSGGTEGSEVAFYWEQIAGPPAALSHPGAAETQLVAPPLPGGNADLRFRLTVTDADGNQAQDEVLVMVVDNGIEGFPPGAHTFFGTGGEGLGIVVESGADLVRLGVVDPAEFTDQETHPPPDRIPYGLVDVTLKLASPGGGATLDVLLPEAADPRAAWFSHTSDGWRAFDSQALISADGGRVTLDLTDGGPLDADGQTNGFITNRSGLAWYAGASAPPATDSDPAPEVEGGGGGGGCFISLSRH